MKNWNNLAQNRHYWRPGDEPPILLSHGVNTVSKKVPK